MHVKDGKPANECESLSKLEGRVTSSSAHLNKVRAKNATDRDLFEGVKTTLSSQKTASQQRISRYVKKHEKLVTDKTDIDADFPQYRTDMDRKLGRLQAFSDDGTKSTNDKEKERERLFLSENSLKAQLQNSVRQ